jgi:plasmid stabilization system protein ParE
VSWEIFVTEPAEAEKEACFLRINHLRGPAYAKQWYAGLLAAIRVLGEFPGPRSFPQSHTESERRREEVRYRIYGGPNTKATLSVSCHIFFAIFDARQGEESGRILILRIVGSQTETASQLLGKTP